MTTSVLIPSFGRPHFLHRCLASLIAQKTPPDEVIVVWQGDDVATKEGAEGLIDSAPFRLRVLHSQERGVVPAENTALDASIGEIILLIDDDAVAPPDWVERHVAHYA